MANKVTEMISNFMTVFSNCSLYSKEHPSVDLLSARVVATLEQHFEEDQFRVTILGDSLYINDRPFSEKSIHINAFIRHLRRKGIEKIIFRKGIVAEEMKSFISEIALTDRVSSGYPHISAGIVEVLMKSDDESINEEMGKNIGQIRELYTGISEEVRNFTPDAENIVDAPSSEEMAEDQLLKEEQIRVPAFLQKGVSQVKDLDVMGIEDVAASFIAAVKRDVNIMKLLSPVKPTDEYLHVHASNVSALSIFQASALGLEGEILHDIGISALLHDIGKAFISPEIVGKEAMLNSGEWTEMKKHPVYGALYLSTLPDLPKLAVIAAYQHHMKFDGTGYPETKSKSSKPHAISRLVAISDFFDTMRIGVKGGKGLEVGVIAGLLRDAAGKDFDPMLVDNFLRALKKSQILH